MREEYHEPIRMGYHFHFNADKNLIEFSFIINGNGFAFGLDVENFFMLIDSLVEVGLPFLENIKNNIERGIKEDIKVDFTNEEFDRLIDLKKKWEDTDGKDD